MKPWGQAHPRIAVMVRWLAALGLLSLTLVWLDPSQIIAPLRSADPRWVGAGVLLSVPMMLLMAWRWSFTASAMGLHLPLRVAWREYYVSVLLNSVLPGGVVGDVVRATRQADGAERPLGPVARSVVVERTVGQLVLWVVVLVGAASWGLGDAVTAVAAMLVGLVLVGIGLWWLSRRPAVGATALGRLLARIRTELRAALWGRRAAAVQLSSSVGSLLALIGIYYCCAAAIGSSLTLVQALLVVPWILAATTIPVTVGGWGVRELSAMAVFEVVSVPAAEGAASSVLFGAIGLLAVVPGIVPLLRRRVLAKESGGNDVSR